MPTNNKFILVVGGAGFIGSHMVQTLLGAGFTPIVLDNLSHGHQSAVKGARLVTGNVQDQNLLSEMMQYYEFEAVLHFAAHIDVAESIRQPAKYYQNNVAATINLLEMMIKHKINRFIYSSSAAVYGEPQSIPITETHPIAPINPYGRSKQMVETILQDYQKSGQIHYATLRYFNAAGADPMGKLGERHIRESHLIPLGLQVALGYKQKLTIYGQDYKTQDGTCIRDYVHVTDLCQAHLLALYALLQGSNNLIYNIGIGQGYSVKEVVEVIAKITGKEIHTDFVARRSGDPAVLLANPNKIQTELLWQPKYPDLVIMVKHAWQFMRNAITV